MKVGCSVVTVTVLPCPSTVTYTRVTGGVGVAAGGGMGEKIVGGGPKEVVPPEVGKVPGVVVNIEPPVVGELETVVIGKLPLGTELEVLIVAAVLDVAPV